MNMEIAEVYFKAKNIVESDLSWEAKYDMIFCKEVSQKAKKLAPSFDWYDPDTTYEEDVMAFFNSFTEYLWD